MGIRKYCKRENPQVSLAQSNQSVQAVEMVAVQWCHICAGTFLWQSGEQRQRALGVKVAWGAGFEVVRELPHQYGISTGLEEFPEKSSSSPSVMGAVKNCFPPEQCYSPYPLFHGCLLLSLYLWLGTTETAAAAVTPRSALRAREAEL